MNELIFYDLNKFLVVYVITVRKIAKLLDSRNKTD